MKTIIDMSADRGAFICQSQSLNLFMENANFSKLTSMHFYAWQKGLKTGMYYLRTKAAADPIKFTLGQKYQNKFETVDAKQNEASNKLDVTSDVQPKLGDDGSFEGQACNLDDPDCLMCGS